MLLAIGGRHALAALIVVLMMFDATGPEGDFRISGSPSIGPGNDRPMKSDPIYGRIAQLWTRWSVALHIGNETEAAVTDDSNLTPGGEMNDTNMTIEMESVPEGHLVIWTKNGVSGQLGPFNDVEVAERAMEAKRLELTVNEHPI